jgi:pyridoxamine 5'-phosphate oxidase
MKEDISKLRSHYEGELLDVKTVCQQPLEQFRNWFNEALDSKVVEPNAMIIATAGSNGLPSMRTVLLKDFSEKGFTFYTNYNSRKGRELAENPHASILFFWPQLHRQVRIEGMVSKVEPAVSEAYFRERPRGSQISAWVSQQSSILNHKSTLDEKYNELEKKYRYKDIPFPEFWGGYCLKPVSFEFWQGQPNRLHDRVVYAIDAEIKDWKIVRLAP